MCLLWHSCCISRINVVKYYSHRVVHEVFLLRLCWALISLFSHHLDSVHFTPPSALGLELKFKCANFLLVRSYFNMFSREKDLYCYREGGFGLI